MREEKMKYERLSKRALGCMYVSTVILSVVLLAAIICVNAFWLSPKDIRVWRDNILGARCSDHSELCDQPVFPVPEIWLSHR